MARAAGGAWLVRVEDVDAPREVAGAADRQLHALTRLGLLADGPVVRQSRRGALYGAALDRLLASGDAFVCHCSRRDLASVGGVHRRCLARRPRPDPAVRFRVPDGCRVGFDDHVQGRFEQDVAREVGDFVLRRADGCWAYQLAVVVDDAAQGITEVVRGADLIDSTPRQMLLQRALGLPLPGYAHLPLILGNDGRKLSKSDNTHPLDVSDPVAALRRAWATLGQDPRAVAGARSVDGFLAAAVPAFERGRIPPGPPRRTTPRQ